MSKLRYIRLGDCVHPVSVRNVSMLYNQPMGVNIDKFFMPSVANIIGTDLSSYKVVYKNQFACNLMHVGRDERLPIALQESNEPIIVSPAYLVLELNEGVEMLPEFLMMWVKQPEFDRRAWFYTDGDVRGGLSRDALFDIPIPFPNIESQRAIVNRYQAVEERIEIHKKTLVELERGATVLYSKICENASSLEDKLLSEIADIVMGQSPEGESINKKGDGMVFYQGSSDFGFRFPSIRMFTTDPTRIAKKGDILLSVRAPVGDINIASNDCSIGRGVASLRSKHGFNSYLYYLLGTLTNEFRVSNDDGTVFGSIGKDELRSIKVKYPGDETVREFEEKAKVIDTAIACYDNEITELIKLKSIILSSIR